MTNLEQTSSDAETVELSDHECRRLLSLAAIGRIAFVADALPVILPVNYRFVSDDTGVWLVLRTRPGHTIDTAPEQVAFEIDGIDHEHRRGWSVLVRGILHHLDHNEVELFKQRFDPKPWPEQERTSWVAIKARSVTGRNVHAASRGWTFPSEGYL